MRVADGRNKLYAEVEVGFRVNVSTSVLIYLKWYMFWSICVRVRLVSE